MTDEQFIYLLFGLFKYNHNNSLKKSVSKNLK